MCVRARACVRFVLFCWRLLRFLGDNKLSCKQNCLQFIELDDSDVLVLIRNIFNLKTTMLADYIKCVENITV